MTVKQETYELSLLGHLAEKQYFEFEDIRKVFPDSLLYVIKGKKNIGKSYAMREEMKKIAESGKKFLLLRLTDGEVKNLARAWNSDANMPFSVKANQITMKDTKQHVGMIYHLSGAGMLGSLDYNDFTHIFFDEYIPLTAHMYQHDKQTTIRLFMNLVENVQRAKSRIEIWCMGNNNEVTDMFSVYFKANYNAPINYWPDHKVLIANLERLYNGIKNTQAKMWSHFDEELRKYLESNASYQDITGITQLSPGEPVREIYQFALNGAYYILYQRQALKNGHLAPLNEFVAKYISPSETSPHLACIALTQRDNIRFKDSIYLDDEQREALKRRIELMIKANTLKFLEADTEKNFQNFVLIY